MALLMIPYSLWLMTVWILKKLMSMWCLDSVCGSGTVVFCCSRSCNQKFFHWWFIERLIPFVRRVKEQFNYAPATPSWSTLDEEYCQLLPLLSQKIHDASIAECFICKKPGGSTTEITQPVTHRSYLFILDSPTFHNHG